MTKLKNHKQIKANEVSNTIYNAFSTRSKLKFEDCYLVSALKVLESDLNEFEHKDRLKIWLFADQLLQDNYHNIILIKK